MKDFVIPDKVGDPIYGWRAWFVVPENGSHGKPVLRSFIYRDLWPAAQIQEAHCHAPRIQRQAHEEEAPVERCWCGIYAHESRAHVWKAYFEKMSGGLFELARIIGQVALWGKIIQGERGARAQFAYPVSFEIPERVTGREPLLSPAEIATALRPYGVPTVITEETVDFQASLR